MKERFHRMVFKQADVFPTQPKVDRRLVELETQMRELATANAQLRSAVRQMGGLVPPPAHLQVRVSDFYYSEFIDHGEVLLEYVRGALRHAGTELDSLERILDFGCGCARVLRALHYRRRPTQQLFGTDIDAEAIEWCARHYPGVAEFAVNPVEPPMAYADGSFDLVYSISIFTHLPEAMQHAWLRELARVTRPGGHLVITTHGRKYFENVPAAERARALTAGFYHHRVNPTEGLPDFYQAAFHTPEYVRARWSEHFEVLDVLERAVDEGQDIVICRNR